MVSFVCACVPSIQFEDVLCVHALIVVYLLGLAPQCCTHLFVDFKYVCVGFGCVYVRVSVSSRAFGQVVFAVYLEFGSSVCSPCV